MTRGDFERFFNPALSGTREGDRYGWFATLCGWGFVASLIVLPVGLLLGATWLSALAVGGLIVFGAPLAAMLLFAE